MEKIAGVRTRLSLRRLGTYSILSIGLLALAAGLWKAHESSFDSLAHLPTAGATVVRIDVATLRRAGILKLFAAKPESEEPDYLSFVQSTGFDYQKDLDQITAAFAPNATYFIVNGRFDWARLESYARTSGGGCYERLCRLQGSKPGRRISFLPLQPNIMALAVSNDDLAATTLRDAHPNTTPALKDPVWISIPASAFDRVSGIAPGLRLFASSVIGADRVTLTLGPNPSGDYAAKLEALCPTPKSAQTIAAQLTQIGAALKSTATFQQSSQKVFGYLPIRKQDLESLAGGI